MRFGDDARAFREAFETRALREAFDATTPNEARETGRFPEPLRFSIPELAWPFPDLLSGCAVSSHFLASSSLIRFINSSTSPLVALWKPVYRLPHLFESLHRLSPVLGATTVMYV